MNKTIIQNTQLTVSRVIQGRNSFNDKISHRQECSTQNSDERLSLGDISILEESSSNINSEFQYNFKKSKLRERSQLRDSTISIVEAQENIKPAKLKSSYAGFHKDIAQLESIEKKTQELAMRERQQRKELKKLKKILAQHQQQMKSKEFSFQIEKTELSNKIDQLQQSKVALTLQKGLVEQKLKNLALQLRQTKDQATKFKIQKQKLLLHLQYLEANLDDSSKEHNQKQKRCLASGDRIGQMVEDITQLDEIENEIQIIDLEINRLKKNTQSSEGYQKMMRFYELRNKYVDKRQELRVKKSEKRYENIIFKLNRLILNRNEELSNHQKKKQQPSDQQAKEKSLAETSDSFFSKTQAYQTIENQSQLQKKQTQLKFDQLAQRITALVEANTIKEYEQIYENIDRMALTLLYLKKAESEPYSLGLIQKSVLGITNCITSKAQRNYQKIRRLMSVIAKQQTSLAKLEASEAKLQADF